MLIVNNYFVILFNFSHHRDHNCETYLWVKHTIVECHMYRHHAKFCLKILNPSGIKCDFVKPTEPEVQKLY